MAQEVTPAWASTHAPSHDALTGIIIVDHGSRKKDSNDMLIEFVQLFKHTAGARIVEPAHMELAEPSIEQAIGALS